MFNTLKFEVQFKNPRRGHSGKFEDTHDFKKGLTIIHGANEAGKSMRAELLRFALWGRRALRCRVSDYSRLVVDLDFTLKDVEYKIHRTKSNATLYQGDDPIATGTSPVNDRVEALFGYDLEVFDLANAVLQGEVEALGKLQPARRKALVDSLIGLNVIDDQIKELVEARKASKTSLAVLESNIVVPEEPIMSDVLSEEEIEAFPKFKAGHRQKLSIQNELKGLQLSSPEAPLSLPQEVLDIASKWEGYQTLLAKSKKHPPRDVEGEDTGLSQNEIQSLYMKALKYEATQTVECPECEHVFNPSGLEKTPLSSADYLELKRRQLAYENSVLAHEKGQEVKVEMENFLDGLLPEQLRQAVVQVRDFERDKRVYENTVKRNQQVTDRVSRLEQDLSKLELYAGDIDLYEKNYNQSLTLKQLLVQYEAYLKVYETQTKQVETLKAEVENYDYAIVGLRNLKVSIKSYLVPSLNKVASSYLSQMTDGARSSVVISESFDIVVDGQPMEALSGSAKAVANLAIRLALGQTLTNSVFSVLLADEIDAAMDQERSDYTAKCLRNLTDSIKQIIIISHKKLDADNYVELK